MANEYDHDVALLEHARHVGELDCGRRAGARLLAQALPEDVENWVRAQQTHYTPTLAELGPIEFQRIDIKPFKPGWVIFNPTLLMHAGQLVGLVRSSNYTFDGQHYVAAAEDNGVIRTKNLFVTYDRDLRPVGAMPLADPEYVRTNFSVQGLEDARLYSTGDCLAVSATVRDCSPHDGRCRIGTAQIDLLSRRFYNLRVAESPSGRHEKNWMPIVGRNCWLYLCNVDGSTETITAHENGWKRAITGPAPRIASHFRGGSQLTPFQGGYLALVHEVAFDNNRRIYSHRFVWFDAQLRLQKYSDLFFFRVKRAVEFAAGLAVRDDAVVASFGVNDKQAWLAVLPVSTVAAQLINAA